MKKTYQIEITEKAQKLLQDDPQAYLLMSQIALRACINANLSDGRHELTAKKNLRSNQAVIGDFKNCGLTRDKYRSTQERLKKYGFVSFRTFSRGTIATITDLGLDLFNIHFHYIRSVND